MVEVGKLFGVDTVGVGEDNLEKGVECWQLLGHEGEDMAGNYYEEMGIGLVG